jgi:hypothetical protein
MSAIRDTNTMSHDERVTYLSEHNRTLDGARRSLELCTAQAEHYANAIGRERAEADVEENPAIAARMHAHANVLACEHADIAANVEALTVIVARLEAVPCSTTYPAFHYDGGPQIRCTLPSGHDGDHEDHSTVEDTGAVLCWHEA